MPAYSLDNLVTDLDDVTTAGGSHAELLQRAVPIARRMGEDLGWIRASFYESSEEQGFGVTVLHEVPGRLLIETICWLPGRGVAPHDHQTWGVVVGLDGPEHNVNWRRLDDGATPGYADLAVASEVVVGAGETITFLPDDIHSVRNETDRPTLSLHIYGDVLAQLDRSEFDPITKVQRPCPQRMRRRD